MDVIERHHVRITGVAAGRPILFAHGFGCDQQMWRLVAPRFEEDFKVVVFDHAGAGRSHVDAYDAERHASLEGYAQDVLAICEELDLHRVVFVGHSVSAIVGVLAAIREPERFAQLVLIGPSPRYIDDGDYVGGFTSDDIDDLLDALASNYLGWSASVAPMIMGEANGEALVGELETSFCRTDPDIARRFAEVTFRSDNRRDLSAVTTPTQVIQVAHDAIAPVAVGQFVCDAIPNCRLTVLDSVGHCPHLSDPDATVDAIRSFVIP